MPIVPDIYILHGGEESEKALADTIAADLAGLPAKVVLMTAEELVLRHKNPMVCIPEDAAAPQMLQGIVRRLRIFREAVQILQGTVVVLLSETLLGDADRRVALVGAVGRCSRWYLE